MSWDWSAWPPRAVDSIYQMLRRSIVHQMVEAESQDRRPIRILMCRRATDLWRTHFRNESRYQSVEHGDPTMFYGMPVFVDRSLDRSGVQPVDFVGEIRIVTDGHGSVPMAIRAVSSPERLGYTVEIGVVGREVSIERLRFDYSYIQLELSRHNTEAQTVTGNDLDLTAQLDGLRRNEAARIAIPEGQAMPEPELRQAAPRPLPARPPISELMVAWLS